MKPETDFQNLFDGALFFFENGLSHFYEREYEQAKISYFVAYQEFMKVLQIAERSLKSNLFNKKNSLISPVFLSIIGEHLAETLNGLALVFYAQGHGEKSLKFLSEALERTNKDETRIITINNRGNILLQLNRSEDALVDFNLILRRKLNATVIEYFKCQQNRISSYFLPKQGAEHAMAKLREEQKNLDHASEEKENALENEFQQLIRANIAEDKISEVKELNRIDDAKPTQIQHPHSLPITPAIVTLPIEKIVQQPTLMPITHDEKLVYSNPTHAIPTLFKPEATQQMTTGDLTAKGGQLAAAAAVNVTAKALTSEQHAGGNINKTLVCCSHINCTIL